MIRKCSGIEYMRLPPGIPASLAMYEWDATTDQAEAAMETTTRTFAEARWEPAHRKSDQLFLEDYPEMEASIWTRSPISSRTRSSRPGCWKATRRARPPRMYHLGRGGRAAPVSTAPARLPGARPRCCPAYAWLVRRVQFYPDRFQSAVFSL